MLKKQSFEFLEMPYGKVPLIEIDGQSLNQSVAICRYLAKKVGLLGQSDFDAAEADSVVDTISDIKMRKSENFFHNNHGTKCTTPLT